jgi:hypothetical protein
VSLVEVYVSPLSIVAIQRENEIVESQKRKFDEPEIQDIKKRRRKNNLSSIHFSRDEHPQIEERLVKSGQLEIEDIICHHDDRNGRVSRQNSLQ